MTLPQTADPRTLSGGGEIPGRSWWRGENDEVRYATPPRLLPLGHPAAYEAGTNLIDAVNTALLLRKPLLVTGKPGTGKTELAERIAYEFDLGPVLRFEAQSLSEANDLFYRFDYIAQLVASKLVKSDRARPEDADVMNFVQWGPLGKAILRSVPGLEQQVGEEARLRSPVRGVLPGKILVAPKTDPLEPAEITKAVQSVVLIDEIDKASRDFPNDLLNGIDRMEFRLRELGSRVVKGAGRDSPFHPIVIVTSNSERDLPHPFMRRCVFVHIKDPSRELMAAIVRKRVFGDPVLPPAGKDGLPPLYSRLLDLFIDLRDKGELRYPIGTSEMLDLGTAAVRRGIDGHTADASVIDRLVSAVSALAKHPDDRERVAARLHALATPAMKPAAA